MRDDFVVSVDRNAHKTHPSCSMQRVESGEIELSMENPEIIIIGLSIDCFKNYSNGLMQRRDMLEEHGCCIHLFPRSTRVAAENGRFFGLILCAPHAQIVSAVHWSLIVFVFLHKLGPVVLIVSLVVFFKIRSICLSHLI